MRKRVERRQRSGRTRGTPEVSGKPLTRKRSRGAARASFSGDAGPSAMVFLTAQLWLRSRLTDRYWRVQEVLKHARVSRPRTPRAPCAPRPRGPAGSADPPPFPFLDPALPGKEEPVLQAGR